MFSNASGFVWLSVRLFHSGKAHVVFLEEGFVIKAKISLVSKSKLKNFF
jgi:hypothetical protein